MIKWIALALALLIFGCHKKVVEIPHVEQSASPESSPLGDRGHWECLLCYQRDGEWYAEDGTWIIPAKLVGRYVYPEFLDKTHGRRQFLSQERLYRIWDCGGRGVYRLEYCK